MQRSTKIEAKFIATDSTARSARTASGTAGVAGLVAGASSMASPHRTASRRAPAEGMV